VTPRRIVVIGGGPAGLAAATRLLERGNGRVTVTMVHMDDLLGGKAASWRRADGMLVEHGWHMVLGFYDELRALMRRAGIDIERALTSMRQHHHCYEPWDDRLHSLSNAGSRLAIAARTLGSGIMPLGDLLNFGRVMAQMSELATSGADLARYDDICFDTFAVEHGLRRHITHYSLFRTMRLGYFNFPEQISAHHILQTMKHMSTSERAEMFVARGGTTEQIWAPIGRYFERLGGTIISRTVVTDFIRDGDRVRGLRVADAKPLRGDDAAPIDDDGALPLVPGTERTLGELDYVISTIPVAVLTRVSASDRALWSIPLFQRMTNLRSTSTMSLTIMTRRPVAPSLEGPIHGLPSPLNFFVNMKRYWSEYAADPAVGAVLVFGGQEHGFEAWSDQQIIDFTLENAARVHEIGDIRAADIIGVEIHRNRSATERLMICEPGVEQFRPHAVTPIQNLFLAGDWVRNHITVICMEGAVTAGHNAADEVLARVRSA
jgi:protoporphyrinogen oxidase